MNPDVVLLDDWPELFRAAVRAVTRLVRGIVG